MLIKTTKTHLYTIDLLRGLAALMVVLFHYSNTGLAKLTHEPTKTVFSMGHLGVQIFFVISGFIIPFALAKSNYTTKNFFSYMGKRIIRICPPAYIIMVLTVLQFYLIDYFHLSRNKWFSTVTLDRVANNFVFTADITHYKWLTGVMWTLAVEFQFYLFAGLFFTVMYKSLNNFLLFAIGLCSTFYLVPNNFNCLFLYGSLFIMGGTTSLFFGGQVTRRQYVILLLLTGVVCYLQLGAWPAISGVLTSLLIAFTAIRNSISTFFGKISYSLYLTHILVGSIVENLIIRFLPHESRFQKDICIALIFAIAIGAAYVYYRIVEMPFIRFSNQLFSVKRQATT